MTDPELLKKRGISNLIASLFKAIKRHPQVFLKEFLESEKISQPTNSFPNITQICSTTEINQLLMSRILMLSKKFKIKYQIVFQDNSEDSIKREIVSSEEIKQISESLDLRILFFQIYSFERQESRASITNPNSQNGNLSQNQGHQNGAGDFQISNRKLITYHRVKKLVKEEFKYLEDKSDSGVENQGKIQSQSKIAGKRKADFFNRGNGRGESQTQKKDDFKRKKVNQPKPKKKRSQGLLGFFNKK